MTKNARGEFNVAIVPQADRDIPMLARMTIDKTFTGGLEATSRGQMLSARSAVPDSAGYVAIERVDGMLDGKKGSFVLQHSATMDRGVPTQTITVVPDSGTDELEGLTGALTVIIADGKHSYDLAYSLPESL